MTLAEIHSAVPKHLHQKNTFKALFYVGRSVVSAFLFYRLAWLIEPFSESLVNDCGVSPYIGAVVKWGLWALYWWWQGIVLGGWWCLGHEAGHCTLSPHNWVNNLVGFGVHTFILAPFFAWRASHNAHHKATNSVERDENYVPKTRKELGLPAESKATLIDYHEIFQDAPIYTLFGMLIMQFLGWQYYLTYNALGSPMYPPGTNHFFPSSPLFKPHERPGIIASDIGISVMIYLLYAWTKQVGFHMFIKLYFVPYLFTNHWVVMLTYLQHSDPTIPHYRKKQWTFLRGATCTVDRPLLGWVGRFFLHNVSHDHLAHHLFSSTPFYNQPQVTECIKKVLKDDYNFDSTNTFRALYRSFTQCLFIEDDGDIVFYKNRDGKAARVLAADALDSPSKKLS